MTGNCPGAAFKNIPFLCHKDKNVPVVTETIRFVGWFKGSLAWPPLRYSVMEPLTRK